MIASNGQETNVGNFGIDRFNDTLAVSGRSHLKLSLISAHQVYIQLQDI